MGKIDTDKAHYRELVQEMANNKTCPVTLKDLNVGQFNGNLWFACSDVLPVTK